MASAININREHIRVLCFIIDHERYRMDFCNDKNTDFFPLQNTFPSIEMINLGVTYYK
jgi:hypothetical protein